jgi:hypothetical protein
MQHDTMPNQPDVAFDAIAPPQREPEVPERLVQVFLSQNLHLLGLGNLQLVELEHQLPDVGRVDILAKGDGGKLYPIEVKRGIATRDAVGQLQSYVGRLMAIHPGAQVLGVLVAAKLDASAHSALIATPTIGFWAFATHFSFVSQRIDRPVLPAAKLPPGAGSQAKTCPFCQSTMLGTLKEDGRTFCRKCGNFLTR